MISLKGSRFTDILPEHLRNMETEALAYAVNRQLKKLLPLADKIPVFAALTSASECVLDHLAIELRTPAYDQTFPVDTKRQLIQNSLLAYAKMGTPAAINRTLTSIFGAGNIEEWFDYEGDPHHFRALIQIRNSITKENLEEFRRILSSIKRLSSWLDGIITITPFDPAPVHISPGMGGCFSSTTPPYREPVLKSAVLRVSPGIGGVTATIHPPDIPPFFQSKITLHAIPCLGGCLTVTVLPPIPRPAHFAVAPCLGGHFSVTELPKIEQGG